jgi:LmbE family N-acetylglucosaminyl deacetylase
VPHQGHVTMLNRPLGTPEWARAAVQRDKRAKVGAAAPRVAAVPGGGSFVTIVAHSDDDLLFINPELQPSLKSGRPYRVIVMTCDEFNGNPPGMSREQLAGQLREGARRAYASLAGVANDWRKETLVVAGKTVEVDTLNPAPQIQSVWLNLPDGGDSLHQDALLNLWETAGYTTTTIVPTGSPVTQVQTYDGGQVYQVLVGLLNLYQPTVVRIQDLYPDERHRSEHADHVATAAFAQLAMKTYEGPTGFGFSLLTRYRCYNTMESGENVPAALLTPKTNAYKLYNALDPLTGSNFDDSLPRSYQRFPVSAPWVIKDGTGVLHAVVVAADSVMAWRLNSGATTWTGPTNLISGSFAPGVAMARNANGRVQLAVLDLDSTNIMTTKQTANGGSYGSWTSLGSPDAGLKYYGTPAFGVNSDNCIEMYLLDSSGGITNAFQSAVNGSITGWFDVGGGPDVMEQPAVITAPSGQLHVFANNNGNVQHWSQPAGGVTSFDPGFPFVEATASPAAVIENGGKARILTRELTDGAVGTSVENTAGGTWSGLTHLGGQGGIGPVATVLSGGTGPRLLAFARNDNYGISMSKQGSGGTFGAWTDLGGYCEIGPTAAVDPAGFVHLLVVGGDCKLYERKQTATGPGGAFGNWTQVGS